MGNKHGKLFKRTRKAPLIKQSSKDEPNNNQIKRSIGDFLAHEKFTNGISTNMSSNCYLSPSGRFAYFQYHIFERCLVVDLWTSKSMLMLLKKQDLDDKINFEIYPLNDNAVLLAACDHSSRRSRIHSRYQISRFEVDFKNLEFRRTSGWTDKIFDFDKIRLFVVDREQLFLLYNMIQHPRSMVLEFINLESKNHEKTAICRPWESRVQNEAWEEYSGFLTYIRPFIYGFNQFYGTVTHSTLSNIFTDLCKIDTRDGKTTIIKILNCLEFPYESANEMPPKYTIDGHWHSQKFYLHIQACQNYTRNYLYVLDLSTHLWTEIETPYKHLDFTVKMLILNGNVMLLLQLDQDENELNESEFNKIGLSKKPLNCFQLHRIPLRNPESLKTLTRVSFLHVYDQQSSIYKSFERILI